MKHDQLTSHAVQLAVGLAAMPAVILVKLCGAPWLALGEGISGQEVRSNTPRLTGVCGAECPCCARKIVLNNPWVGQVFAGERLDILLQLPRAHAFANLKQGQPAAVRWPAQC